MDPVLTAALSSWDIRLDVVLSLALAAMLYVRGWWRLQKKTSARRDHSRWQAGARWRPLVYLAGLVTLGIALMSPIDVLAGQLFTMHMVQHVFLVMLVPPLLLLANPLPFLLWGLPNGPRLEVGRWLGREGILRRILQKVTGPGWVWLIFVTAYWGWHDPNAYNLALQNSWVHDLEHLSFFGTSMLFWWHVIGAGPRVHRPLSPMARIAYLLSAIPPSMFAGLAIAFATQPIYPYYEVMPRLWGLSVMTDQRIAGIIMWVPGSMMYMIAALILAGRWLQDEGKKPALPESAWAADEALLAPGWEK